MSNIDVTAQPTVRVQARNVAVDPHWLERVVDRVGKLDRFGNGVVSFDVEVTHNPNPSRHPAAWRVELSAKLRKHTIRATGQAPDPERAFTEAKEVLEANLRRAAKRMQFSRHGRKSTAKLREVLA